MPEARVVLDGSNNAEFKFGGDVRAFLLENNNVTASIRASTKQSITVNTTLDNENSKVIRTNGNWGLEKEDTEGLKRPITKLIIYSGTALTVDITWTLWEDFETRE